MDVAPDQIGIGEVDAGAANDAGVAAPAPPAPANAVAAPPAVAACTVTSRATAQAPDGTPDTRNTVGVCETIEFDVGKVANWTATTGQPGTVNGAALYNWAAPDVARTSTIRATVPLTGETCSLDIKVVAPTGITYTKLGTLPYAAGTAGAGMTLRLGINPRTVNFGWIALLEDPGPASGVGGYFAARAAAGADLSHHPAAVFKRVGWDNNLCCDTAATVAGVLHAPWAAGTFRWNIPDRYRCLWSTGAGHVFTHTDQRFSMDAAGKVTVGKDGQAVTRSP